MAKKKTKVKKPQKQTVKGAPMSNDTRLYKRMIMNPCTGPMVMSPLPGGTGHLIRLRKVISWSTIVANMTPTTDARNAIFIFQPGSGHVAYKAVSSGTVALDTAAGANASTGLSLSAVNSPPDFTFLAGANVKRFRPLAACMDFKNLAPSNSIGGGIIAGTLGNEMSNCVNNSSNNPTFDDVFANFETKRMSLEQRQIWRPRSEHAWSSYANDVSTVLSQVPERSCLAYGFRLPGGAVATNADFDIIITAIYEYDPEASTGIAHSQERGSFRETIESIISDIPSDFWQYGTTMAKRAVGSYLASAYPYQRAMLEFGS